MKEKETYFLGKPNHFVGKPSGRRKAVVSNVVSRNVTQEVNLGKIQMPENAVFSRARGSGVILPLYSKTGINDTSFSGEDESL